MPTFTVVLDDADVAMLRLIYDFMTLKIAGGRSPKSHEIVPLKSRFKLPRDRDAIARFRRLVAVGAIEHSRNGHCWLTDAGQLLVDEARHPRG